MIKIFLKAKTFYRRGSWYTNYIKETNLTIRNIHNNYANMLYQEFI